MNDSVTSTPRKKRTLSIKSEAELPLSGLEPEINEPFQEHPTTEIPVAEKEERRAHSTLQLGFFIAVVLGISTATAGMIDQLTIVGFAGPLLTIIGFYIFGSIQGFMGRSDTRQQFADSCYFLGFLLTMIAMLAGFLPAGLFDQEITSQGILRHFSMALGATALGLVCRILVLQGGRSLGEISADVEATLTQYAREVSDEAKLIAVELTSVRADLKAQRDQVASLVTTDLKQSVDAAFRPIVSSANEISDSLRKQTEQIVVSAQRLQTALSQSATQVVEVNKINTEANGAAEAAIFSVAQSLGNFESQMNELRLQLGTIVSSSTAQIEKMTRAFEQGIALAPTLEPILDTISGNVTAVSQRIDEVKDQSEAFALRVTSSMAADGRLLGGLEEAQGKIIVSLGEAGETAREAIIEQADTTRDAMRVARIELTANMNENAERFENDLTAATDRLAVILNAFAEKIEQARDGKAQ